MSYRDNYDNIDWTKSNYKVVKAKKRTKSHQVMGDIQEFVSPIDKSVISSRSQVREHERKHNVRQSGNDYTSSTKPKFWDNMINNKRG
tara:strand:+ start:155 stop:418 length:264 start_codon:yes stop_codon:yes gene_type:complete